MSFFSVSDLTAGYGPRPVLEQIAFSLEAGKILGILGPTAAERPLCSRPSAVSCPMRGVVR